LDAQYITFEKGLHMRKRNENINRSTGTYRYR
jgi:hypothetical protein